MVSCLRKVQKEILKWYHCIMRGHGKSNVKGVVKEVSRL
jgi:hypothetical protein